MPTYNYIDGEEVEVYSTRVNGVMFSGTPEEFVEYKVEKERQPPHFANSNPNVTFEEKAERYCQEEYMIDDNTGEKRSLPDSFCDKFTR